MYKPCILSIILCIIFLNCWGQSFSSETKPSSAINNALDIYHDFLASESDIYNGKIYIQYYSPAYEGIPFLDTTKLLNGNIVYNKILYKDVPLMYDILKNKVVILTNGYMVELINDKINSFSLNGRRFEKLEADFLGNGMEEGLYEIVHHSHNNLIIKNYKKNLREDLSSGKIVRSISDKNTFYIKTDDVFYKVSKKKDVLNVYDKHRREIAHYIRKNNLRLNKKNINNYALAAIAEHYNQLEK